MAQMTRCARCGAFRCPCLDSCGCSRNCNCQWDPVTGRVPDRVYMDGAPQGRQGSMQVRSNYGESTFSGNVLTPKKVESGFSRYEEKPNYQHPMGGNVGGLSYHQPQSQPQSQQAAAAAGKTVVGPTGPQGAQGPMGPKGDTGPAGAAGSIGILAGCYDSLDELKAKQVNPAAGKFFLVNREIFFWDVTKHGWMSAGYFDGSNCLKQDHATLFKAGKQGPMGPVGNQGPVGPRGEIGPTGSTGPRGPQGFPGEPGVPGMTGSIGERGPRGHQGPQGFPGEKGIPGIPGATGPTGSMGMQGLPGFSGATGPTGPMGPMGMQGAPGISGVKGPTGSMGMQGLPGIPGATGPIGMQGAPGISGATGPMGPMGMQGLPGISGATGPMGPMGMQGLSGIPGATGPTGPTGKQGVPGAPGVAGTPGPIGHAGIQGPTGAQGVAGPTGPVGAPGKAAAHAHFESFENSDCSNAVFAREQIIGIRYDGKVIYRRAMHGCITCAANQNSMLLFGQPSPKASQIVDVGGEFSIACSDAYTPASFTNIAVPGCVELGNLCASAYVIRNYEGQLAFMSCSSVERVNCPYHIWVTYLKD